jgi:hypothetical protein
MQAGTLADYGDLEGARSRLEEVLAIKCRILGKDRPDALSTMNSLGVVLGGLRDYLALAPGISARSMSNLAATLWMEGNGARGIDLQERAVETAERAPRQRSSQHGQDRGCAQEDEGAGGS